MSHMTLIPEEIIMIIPFNCDVEHGQQFSQYVHKSNFSLIYQSFRQSFSHIICFFFNMTPPVFQYTVVKTLSTCQCYNRFLLTVAVEQSAYLLRGKTPPFYQCHSSTNYCLFFLFLSPFLFSLFSLTFAFLQRLLF